MAREIPDFAAIDPDLLKGAKTVLIEQWRETKPLFRQYDQSRLLQAATHAHIQLVVGRSLKDQRHFWESAIIESIPNSPLPDVLGISIPREVLNAIPKKSGVLIAEAAYAKHKQVFQPELQRVPGQDVLRRAAMLQDLQMLTASFRRRLKEIETRSL